MQKIFTTIIRFTCLLGCLLGSTLHGESHVLQGGPATNGKIPIDPQRWYQPTNAPDGIAALFDGVTSVNITVGYGQAIDVVDSFYPLEAGETITIDSIKFFDGWGSNANHPMTLSIITSTWQRVPIATFTGLQYGWVGPYPNRPTTFALDAPVTDARYLVLTSAWAYPTEMELYGSYTPPTVTIPGQTPAVLASQKQVKLGQTLGINAFEWDLEDPNWPSQVDTARLRTVKNFTGIRHYLDWEKLETTQGAYTFNPSASGGWDYDVMYKRLKQEGVTVLTCIKTVPAWLQASYPAAERDPENVPVSYGQDFAAPASYIAQAKVAFQFAARYGRNTTVNPALLSGVIMGPVYPSAPTTDIRTLEIGLGYIKYMECDNERDKWWKGRKAYQTPAEYAANLSAFYDGHKNTMGAGVGVKNADPTMQIVMAGLACPTPDYVRGMIDWCRQYRGYKSDGSVDLCWDVINYHHYSNDASTSQSGTPTRGAAPEVSDAAATAQAFVAMAHQYAADMPVWVTEAGFDLSQSSPLKAIAINGRTVEQTQADWLLRTALAYARWGIERVALYQLYDDNPTSGWIFSTMGLANDNRTPRLAAQYLSQVNKVMGEYRYQQSLSTNPAVDRYHLNGRQAYVLVVPDEQGRTASYTLNLGAATYADVYQLTAGSAMAVQRVAIQGGSLTLQLSETPVFVIPEAATPLPVTLLGFTAQLQNAASVRLAWATASELNSDRFEVERSTNGVAFTRIGQLPAAGTSTVAHQYQLLDSNLPPEPTLLYYRLRQVDPTTTATYSPVRTVALAASPSGLVLAPNPATHRATTLSGAQPNAAVQIFDAVGRLVATAKTNESGTAQIVLPAELLAGIYLVRVENKATRMTLE
jgi:endoglucanase